MTDHDKINAISYNSQISGLEARLCIPTKLMLLASKSVVYHKTDGDAVTGYLVAQRPHDTRQLSLFTNGGD